jgi:integrase
VTGLTATTLLSTAVLFTLLGQAAQNGGPWWPSNFDRIWRRFKKKQGIEIRFHDLRHTHATQLLKAGVHPEVVSERLGHASIGITLDPYSHVMPGMQDAAAENDRRGAVGATGRIGRGLGDDSRASAYATLRRRRR